MTRTLNLSPDEIEAGIHEYYGPSGPFEIEDVQEAAEIFVSGWVMPRAVAAEAADTDFEGIERTAHEILTGMYEAHRKRVQ